MFLDTFYEILLTFFVMLSALVSIRGFDMLRLGFDSLRAGGGDGDCDLLINLTYILMDYYPDNC